MRCASRLMHTFTGVYHMSQGLLPGGRRRRRYSLRAHVLLLAVLVVVLCLFLGGLLRTSRSTADASFAAVPCVDCKAGDVADVPENEAVAGNGRRVAAKRRAAPLSPPMFALVKPFQDLCEWVTGTHVSRKPYSKAAAADLADYSTDPELRAQLESAMDRFDHIPADGGAAGRRWSAATGLPLASHRTGDVKVRFMTVSNRLDPMMHFASVTAAMAGVRLEMIGKGWKHFSFVKRLSLLLSYAEVEGLSDADVIVATDADAVMSGEDAESFFAAFVASTAASEEEHMTYSVRDIRTGKRQAPVLFSGESSCWHWETFTRKECPAGYEKVYEVREEWVATANVSLQRGYNRANPYKYLNAGVMVTRVWALRLLKTLFLNFARSQKPRRKFRNLTDWWCDQSAFGGMYLDLIWWELRSNALDGAPKRLSASLWQESLYPPKTPLAPGRGPHGLPAGFLGVDQATRLSMTIEPLMNRHGWFGINGEVVRQVDNPVPALKAALAKGVPLEMSPLGVVRSSHHLAVTPRLNVDCAGVASVPPECAYRDAVLGIPEGATAVAPLMWHFAGFKKSERFVPYRTVFPWYTPTVTNSTALQTLVHVFANIPATRVFSIDPKTNTGEYLADALLAPHNAADDVTTVDMCYASVLKPTA